MKMKNSVTLLTMIIVSNLLMGQNDKNSVSYLKKLTDNGLLKEGYYKINQSDSIYFWIKAKSLDKFIDYSNCKPSTVEKAKYNLKCFLDSTEILFEASGDKPLYKSKYFLTPKNLMNELGKNEYPLIENCVYNLFIQPWFGIVTANYLKLRSQFSIKLLNLESRGKYIKVECNNDYLSSDFNSNKLISSVVKLKKAIPLILWLPMSGSGTEIKPDSVNMCIEELLNCENSLIYKKPFSSFSDTSSIVCLSYNKQIPEKGQLTINKPCLELFFTAFDDNKTVIISNGIGYAAYSFENISNLKELIRKQYLKVN